MSSARRGAIVGFGNVAEKGHLPGWLESRDFEIVAVADPAPARRALAAALIPGARTYVEHEELLSRESLDFIDIASPPALHLTAIHAAAKAGVHILCEKPLTTDAEAYKPIRRAIDDAGVLLHVVHNWKFSEAFQTLSRLLANGDFGRIRSAAFVSERDGWSASDGDWRVKRSLAGGGILVDHGWHNFYLLLSLARQDPVAIAARLEKRRYVDAEIEDTAMCRIDFADMTAEIHLTWAATERRTCWEVTAERGRIVVDDDVVRTEHDGAREERRLRSGLSAGSHHADWFPGVIESFRRELGDPNHRGTNRSEAEWCLLLLDQAYAAAARGAAISPLGRPAELLA